MRSYFFAVFPILYSMDEKRRRKQTRKDVFSRETGSETEVKARKSRKGNSRKNARKKDSFRKDAANCVEGEKREKGYAASATFERLFLGALFLGCVVLESLCLKAFKNGIFFVEQKWVSVLVFAVTIACFIVATAFSLTGKKSAYRFCVGTFVLFLFLLIVFLVMQKTGLTDVFGDEVLFREYMERAGAKMPLLYIAFQFLQVVVLPVPAFVSTAAGVALFGAGKAALCSFVGIVSGSFLAFFIGRKIGYKAVAWMVGEDTLLKWTEKIKGKDYFILTAMFVLPLFPDDVLCFVAGLSTMSWQYFVVMIVLARSLGIVATCYSVDLIPFNTPWGIAIWGGTIVFLAVSFFLLYKHMDKLNDFFKRKGREMRDKRRKRNENEDERKGRKNKGEK